VALKNIVRADSRTCHWCGPGLMFGHYTSPAAVQVVLFAAQPVKLAGQHARNAQSTTRPLAAAAETMFSKSACVALHNSNLKRLPLFSPSVRVCTKATAL